MRRDERPEDPGWRRNVVRSIKAGATYDLLEWRVLEVSQCGEFAVVAAENRYKNHKDVDATESIDSDTDHSVWYWVHEDWYWTEELERRMEERGKKVEGGDWMKLRIRPPAEEFVTVWEAPKKEQQGTRP